MASSQRIKGAKLILTIDTTDYAADVMEAVLSFEDRSADEMTFADAAEGGDQGKLKITAVQSTATASFWRKVWDAAGTLAVPFALAAHGNSLPSEDQPHVTGTVDIKVRPDIGGKADPTKSYTFEVEWQAEVDRELKIAP